MNIGLDFDGVISDATNLKIRRAKELHNLDISAEKFKKEIIVGENLLTKEEYLKLKKEIYATKELGLLIDIVPEAKEYIERLKADGHTVSIITSRFGPEHEVAELWLTQNKIVLPVIPVVYPESKANAARELDLDIFIDDDFDKLEELSGVVPHLFLFSWPYNKDIDEKNIATRVFSWQDFYTKIKKLL